MKTILVATNNKHKLKEYRDILTPLGYRVLGPLEANIHEEPLEDGLTYRENSLIKAKAMAKLTSLPVIADDSGIEIEGLGQHFPGVYSARYSASLSSNNLEADEMILAKLKDEPNRKASFHCCICLLEENRDDPRFFEGICEGEITTEISGDKGFGYDPIFRSKESNLYFGACREEEKNNVSHRGKATKSLVLYLSKKE